MKFKRFTVFILCLLMLCSCAKTEDDFITNENDGISYDDVNTDGINGVYIVTDKGPVPIAYTKNGSLSLQGDVYYYNLRSILEIDDSVKQKTFTYFDINGCNIGGKSYSEFSENAENPYKTLVLTGNWRLCPDMRHIEYGNNSTPPTEYEQYFLTNFENELTKDNLKITDVWESDIDKDGTNDALVKAKGEGYTVIALLSETIGDSVLLSHFGEGEEFDATPFIADLDGNGIPSVLVLSGDRLKTVCVFKEKTSTISYCVYLPIQ